MLVSYTVVLAHAVVLGLPVFWIFWWKRWINLITCIGTGFVIAAASGIVPNWPVGPKGRNTIVGAVPLVIEGVPTSAGWLDFLRVLMFLGFLGAFAGVVFRAILGVTGALEPFVNGAGVRQRVGAIGLGAVALLLSGTVMAIPEAFWVELARRAQDQTCHNVLRDRETIAPQVGLNLQLASEDAPKLRQAMEAFAAAHKLQVRTLAAEPARSAVSLCNDRLTIKASLNEIDVFELQPQSGWQQISRGLIARIETLWPGKLRFRLPTGGEMPRPKGLR